MKARVIRSLSRFRICRFRILTNLSISWDVPVLIGEPPFGALCGQRVQVPLSAPPGKTLLAFHRTLGRVRGTS